MALSLVVANPPRLENRVLPREHVAQIGHPAYVPPPSVADILSSRPTRTYLSNATLVVAPMTLCPQWAGEIERFAPWMSFITLHNDEIESAAEIASKDIVIVSTFIMSQPTGKQGSLLSKLRAIHFHRIFLDESHYNNTGERVKLSLAQLSSTHRYCVTGTPVGHSLADLYGQLRFLRVPEFCRPDFWEQNISSPYSERNCYALNVLRSLLSRMVIRHSKEQTLNNGDALVSLPPRNVETLLLPFGSEAEKKIYEVSTIGMCLYPSRHNVS
jgi:DNA repair protein RAD5